jgi:hypothetical protein
MSHNNPDDKKGFTIAFIIGSMVVIGVAGAVLIDFLF